MWPAACAADPCAAGVPHKLTPSSTLQVFKFGVYIAVSWRGGEKERDKEAKRRGDAQFVSQRPSHRPSPSLSSLPQVPAALTILVATNVDAVNAIINRHSYVVYPPEGPRPPPPDQVRAAAKSQR